MEKYMQNSNFHSRSSDKTYYQRTDVSDDSRVLLESSCTVSSWGTIPMYDIQMYKCSFLCICGSVVHTYSAHIYCFCVYILTGT